MKIIVIVMKITAEAQELKSTVHLRSIKQTASACLQGKVSWIYGAMIIYNHSSRI